MDEPDRDRAVRGAIAHVIRERGSILSIAEVATRLGIATADASFQRLREAHVFIPQPDSAEIYAYNPFCVGPTEFRVSTPRGDWKNAVGGSVLPIASPLRSDMPLLPACADGTVRSARAAGASPVGGRGRHL